MSIDYGDNGCRVKQTKNVILKTGLLNPFVSQNGSTFVSPDSFQVIYV
ncbi:hypothetical protein PMI05_04927 [Brevibacillus sp. BC25]|nr:hypothetical protein PMI05_04927 [Brevibacillus sp. BC25]